MLTSGVLARRVFLASALVAVGGGARTADAQRVLGTVRDSASREPLAGAVVTLLGASNAVITRGLTDARGQFRVDLSPAIQRFRVVRIGFRPREIAAPISSADTIRLTIDLAGLPSMLEPFEVRANSRCPRRSDDAATFALLEQARAGLLATVVSRQTDPAAMVRLTFDRLLDGTSDRIAHHAVRLDSAGATEASFFASHSAADFVRDGFMDDDAGLQRFYAPDARVLLDEAFASGYCFRVQHAPASRPNEIGLGFTAAARRAMRVDVDGTLWIDTVARALRDVEFRYDGLPDAVMRLHPGGTVSFREVVPGLVLVDRWTLRLVGAVDDTVPNPSAHGDPMVRTTFYLREEGGVLAHARWPDGRRWDAMLGRFTGRALRSDSTPAVHVVLALVGAPYTAGETARDAGTPYRVTTDARGSFQIPDLLAGPYSVIVIDPQLVPIDYQPPTGFAFVAHDGSTATGTVSADRFEDVIYGRCLAHPKFGRADSALVFGRAMTAAGQPVAGVDLTLDWREARPPAKWHPTASYRGTGTDGLFFMCAKALGDSIRTSGRINDHLVGEMVQPVAGHLTVVPLRVTRP